MMHIGIIVVVKRKRSTVVAFSTGLLLRFRLVCPVVWESGTSECGQLQTFVLYSRVVVGILPRMCALASACGCGGRYHTLISVPRMCARASSLMYEVHTVVNGRLALSLTTCHLSYSYNHVSVCMHHIYITNL
jgi:hypothetical protein